MYIGEAVVKLGGIGMVVTSPEYRGRGYASALLRDAIACMEAQKLRPQPPVYHYPTVLHAARMGSFPTDNF